MSETEIQRLRVKIIKGLSISSHKLIDQKVRNHAPIAIMKDNQIEVIDAECFKQCYAAKKQ